jgi:hypothetical protein
MRESIGQADSKKANEWGGAARNVAVAGGVATDKSRVIDELPTERVETLPYRELVRVMVEKGILEPEPEDVIDAPHVAELETQDR